MPKGIKTRKAKPADVETITKMVIGIAKLEQKTSLLFRALDKSKLKEFEKYVRNGVKRKNTNFVLVAEAQGRIIGFIYCMTQKKPIVYKVKKLGYIRDLFVLPKYRKKGIAKLLIQEVEKEFKKRKLKHIALDVLVGNKQAIKVYKKIGFKEFGKDMRKTI